MNVSFAAQLYCVNVAPRIHYIIRPRAQPLLCAAVNTSPLADRGRLRLPKSEDTGRAMTVLAIEPIWGLWLALLALGTALAMFGTRRGPALRAARAPAAQQRGRRLQVRDRRRALRGAAGLRGAGGLGEGQRRGGERRRRGRLGRGALPAVGRPRAGRGGACARRSPAYLEATVRDDWPAMARGEESRSALEALDAPLRGGAGVPAGDARGAVVQAEALRQLDQLTEARRRGWSSPRASCPG